MSAKPKVAPTDEKGYTARPGVLAGVLTMFREASRWGDMVRTPYGIAPVLLVGILFAVNVMQQQFFAVAGPNIAQDLGLDLRVIGGIFQIVGILSIGSTVGVGWLGDRVKRKPLVAGGAVVAALGTLLQTRATTTNGYATPRVATQMAVSVAAVPATSLLADWYPLEVRGRAFALLGVLSTLGTIVGTVILGFAVSAYGWRGTGGAVALVLLVVGLAMFLLKEPVRGYFEKRAMGMTEAQAREEDPPQSFGEALRTTWAVRTVRRIFIADIVLQMGLAPFAIFLGFFLADQYGLDAKQRGLVLMPALFASVVGGFMGGGLVDTLGRRSPGSILRLIAAFNAFPLLALPVLALGPPLWVAVAALCVFYFGSSLGGPGLNVIYSQVIPPTVRTQGLQLNTLATIPAFLIIGVYTGVQFSYGFGPTFLLAVPFLVVGCLIIFTAADFFEGDSRNALLASTAAEEAKRLQSEGAAKLLICRGVSVFYGGNQVLFDVDFDVEEGEIVALLGTNGAGKSTLLRAISGTQEAADGAIIVDGRNITHMPPHEIAARRVVHMPGGKGVFPGLTVEENIRLGTWLAEAGDVARLTADAYALFPVLEKRKNQQAAMLSGGEQQMLALAQAFMAGPRLLMIDELSLGLSPAMVGELLEKVKEIHRRGTTIIVVEQSVNVALNLAKRAVFMEKGEVKFAGPTADLLQRPDILRSVYVKGTGALTAPGASAAAGGKRSVAAGAQDVLEARGITKHFGGITALSDVSLRVREGEIVGLVGPNGSGKTTLFDVLSGYQSPDAGQVIYQGAEITGLSPDERARRKLIRRFQDARLFPSLTVHESLMVALDQRMEVRNAAMGAIQLPPARRAERITRARADRLIDILELGAFQDKFVKELSTGLRRIVDLAFVLATEPKVLLLDEPSSGMAQSEAEGLAPLLKRVRFETGCSILIIEHDMPLISAVSDQLVALVNGSVLTHGTADEVLNDPSLVEAFLGGSEAAIQRSGNLA